MIQKQLCEALYAANRRKEAGESLLRMVSIAEEGVNVSSPITAWVSGELCFTCSCAIHLKKFDADFVQRCLFTRESSGDVASEGHDDVLFHELLREWAKIKLTSGSWKDALDGAVNVGIHSLCYPSGLDTPLVCSVWPKDLRFIGPSVNASRCSTRQRMRLSVSAK